MQWLLGVVSQNDDAYYESQFIHVSLPYMYVRRLIKNVEQINTAIQSLGEMVPYYLNCRMSIPCRVYNRDGLNNHPDLADEIGFQPDMLDITHRVLNLPEATRIRADYKVTRFFISLTHKDLLEVKNISIAYQENDTPMYSTSIAIEDLRTALTLMRETLDESSHG